MSYCNNCWSIHASQWQSDRCCQHIKNREKKSENYWNDMVVKSNSDDNNPCNYAIIIYIGLGLLIISPQIFLIIVLLYFLIKCIC